MENVGRIKNVAVVLLTTLSSWLGVLALPLGLLVVSNVIDYTTGLIAAPRRGEQRSSDRGFMGIAKKVCSWLLVAVGCMVDAILSYVIDNFGWDVPFTFVVATLVCLWLLANEMLSIIENISDIGVNVPPFLRPVIEWVKKKAEDKAGNN